MKSLILPIITLLFIVSCKEKFPRANTSSKPVTMHLPYFNSPDFTPEWEKGTHKIPDFSFINQNGEEITNKAYEGKIYIADFFFASCSGICPKLANNMSILQDTYKENDKIMLLSHSVMPWKDTPKILNEYARTNDVINSKWNLVTGDKNELYKIARTGYFADEDFTKTQDENDFIHTENFILVDGNGYIRGVYNGTLQIDLKRLMRHIEILQKEIS
jgi:protein SCO1/2